jgi:hypothetical protein
METNVEKNRKLIIIKSIMDFKQKELIFQVSTINQLYWCLNHFKIGSSMNAKACHLPFEHLSFWKKQQKERGSKEKQTATQ